MLQPASRPPTQTSPRSTAGHLSWRWTSRPTAQRPDIAWISVSIASARAKLSQAVVSKIVLVIADETAE